MTLLYCSVFPRLTDKNDEVCREYADRLKGLDRSLQSVEKSVEDGNAELQRGVATWQEFEAALDVIRPWLEEAETKISAGMPKPVVLNDAREHLQQIKVSPAIGRSFFPSLNYGNVTTLQNTSELCNLLFFQISDIHCSQQRHQKFYRSTQEP